MLSAVAAHRGVTCTSLVLKRLVFRLLMKHLVRITWERALAVHGALDGQVHQRVAHLHRAFTFASSWSRAAPGYHVAGTTVRSEKQMAHVMAHLDICETGEMPWAEHMKITCHLTEAFCVAEQDFACAGAY